MDSEWGHSAIKLAGHPPFGAQTMPNRHEYVACRARRTGLGLALGLDEQERTAVRYAYAVSQVEYSRNLLYHRGRQLEQVVERMVDCTRGPLAVPQVRTPAGAKRRHHWPWPHHAARRLAVVVESPMNDPPVVKVHFGSQVSTGRVNSSTRGRDTRLSAILERGPESLTLGHGLTF